MSDNVFLKALDRAVSALAGEHVTNAAKTKTVVEYPQPKPGPSLYKGATENGRATAAPLGPEGMRELHPKIRPSLPPNHLDGVPFPTPAQQAAFDAFLRERGYAPPADVAKKLAALDVPWVRLQDAIGETRKSQNANYHSQLADIATRIAAGDSTANERDAWTREDWQQDADERCRVFKTKCREIEAEAWQLAEAALLTKADAADAAADELEAEARPRFEQFAVAYRPAPYVLLLRKYAATLRDGSRRNVGKPSAMIETL